MPAGTYDGETVVVTGGGTGLGKAIASEFARLGANIVIASGKPEHREAGEAAMTELGAPVLTVECDIRDADSIAAMFDAAVERFALPRVLVNNAAANFPVPGRDLAPNRGAPGRQHPAAGPVLVRPGFPPPPPRSRH